MCDTCGCNDPDSKVTFRKPGEDPSHWHGHEPRITHEHEHTHKHGSHTHPHSHPDFHEHSYGEHSHHHDHDHSTSGEENVHPRERKYVIEQDVLGKNKLLAERNRGYFEAKKITAVNLVSSPGSGKTTLLEKTITSLKNDIAFSVIEGDQQTMNDANRISAAGVPVIQINTASGCHLDASMVKDAATRLQIADHSILFIENVGNLVCPALFDLGESYRIVIISVTEGDDKPQKYPYMFHSSDICIINKIDLLPYVDFNIAKAKEYALNVNHHLHFFEISAKTGEGMEEWFAWLKKL